MPEPMMLKTMFDWEHFCTYLSGPIDFDKFARDWRADWTRRLIEIGFKPSQIFDPCRKPLSGAQFNLDNEGEMMAKHRGRREWSELTHIMSQIVHVDLRLCDKSDLVLVNFPKAGRERYEKLTSKFESAFQRLESDVESNPAATEMRDIYYGLLSQISEHRVPTYGTVHEIVEARQQRKPVLVVWEGGKETCSAWIMWLVGHHNIFGSIDELITRLDNISKGRTAFNARDWLLLDLGRNNNMYNELEKET